MLTGMQSQIIYNQWFGKAVGFTIAFVVAPQDNTLLAACVIIGVGIGHALDAWAISSDRPGPRFAIPDVARTQARHDTSCLPVALEFLFAALGTIAKSTGTVTPEHIRYAERLMIHLKLTASQKKAAVQLFDTGKAGRFAFARHAPGLLRHTNAAELRHMILQAMVDIAAIVPADPAISNCVKIAQHLHIAGAVVAEEFSLAMAARHPKAGNHSRSSTRQNRTGENKTRQQGSEVDGAAQAQLLSAYKTLLLKPYADAETTKTAYRRLISKHHPDKLSNTATPRQLEIAQVQMVALRDALETIEAYHAANHR